MYSRVVKFINKNYGKLSVAAGIVGVTYVASTSDKFSFNLYRVFGLTKENKSEGIETTIENVNVKKDIEVITEGESYKRIATTLRNMESKDGGLKTVTRKNSSGEVFSSIIERSHAGRDIIINQNPQGSSKNSIHFFHLGGIIQELRVAILLKDMEKTRIYYGQLEYILKGMKLKCPPIDEIEKNEKILLDPIHVFLYENEGFLADVYRMGSIVAMLLRYDDNHSAYKKACSDLLKIADIYNLRKECNDWVSNLSKCDKQKHLDEMETIIKRIAANSISPPHQYSGRMTPN